MPTFKAVVQKHQERRDGKFPVSIRVTQNRKSIYLPTGLYVSKSQISKKSFEIKDTFVLARVGSTINEYEKKMLGLPTDTLRQVSLEELRSMLTSSSRSIDYLGYCDELVESDKDKWSTLSSAVKVIREMGISRMNVTDFTSSFIYKYKAYLDSKTNPSYKNNTKNSYLISLCKVFRMLQKQYNTEFNKVIPHDPFIGFEYYKDEVTRKRSLSADSVRRFFLLNARTRKVKLAQDIMMFSFCMCGLNIIDIMSLEKSNWDKSANRIYYERRKTKGVRSDKAFSSIHIEPELQSLFDAYLAPEGSKYLFDFDGMLPSHQSSRTIGMNIDRLCKENNFQHVSPYWFRHTWATIARNDCDISKDDIDLCLNHVGNNPMADVYIKPDWSHIDRANRKVLDFVFSNKKMTLG